MNERIYLSFCSVTLQGHAAPILYAAWAEAGFVKESELLNLRKLDCELEGHPTPVSMDVPNGSSICQCSRSL